MAETMVKRQHLLGDGRRILYYGDGTSAPVRLPLVTVVTGSNPLARGIARALGQKGMVVAVIDRYGRQDPWAHRVFQGSVAVREIWEVLAHQYRIRSVIHTASLDRVDPADLRAVFSRTVGEGMAMLNALEEMGGVPMVAASHASVYSVEDYREPARLAPLSIYGENLRQLEQQLRLFAGRGQWPLALLRVFQTLAPQDGGLSDLWGAPLVPAARPVLQQDSVPLDDAVNAFVCAEEYVMSLKTSSTVFDIGSGGLAALPEGVMPVWGPHAGSGSRHWQADTGPAGDKLGWWPNSEAAATLWGNLKTREDSL